MKNYLIRVEVPDGEVKRILDRLTKAQDEIYKCYSELEDLGVLSITKNDADSGN